MTYSDDLEIRRFSQLIGFLPDSAVSVVWDKMTFPTATHLLTWLMFDSYQFYRDDAQKRKDIAIARGRIRSAPAPFEVRGISAAYNDLIRPDWEDIKEEMTHLVALSKYDQHVFLRNLLSKDMLLWSGNIGVVNPDDLVPWFKILGDSTSIEVIKANDIPGARIVTVDEEYRNSTCANEVASDEKTTYAWSEPSPPSEACRYDHVTLQTPLGQARIEWKSWKPYCTYVLYLVNEDGGEEYVGSRDTLEAAKLLLNLYLKKKYDDLKAFLSIEKIEMIKVPLPTGIEDTPENREKLMKFALRKP